MIDKHEEFKQVLLEEMQRRTAADVDYVTMLTHAFSCKICDTWLRYLPWYWLHARRCPMSLKLERELERWKG